MSTTNIGPVCCYGIGQHFGWLSADHCGGELARQGANQVAGAVSIVIG
jgi:hypothetical protein